jgi:hypothetical protein
MLRKLMGVFIFVKHCLTYSVVDAFDLERRAFVRPRQDQVHRPVALAYRVHPHHSLLFGTLTTQRAGARLDVMRRGELAYAIAHTYHAIGDLRFLAIEP